MCSPFSISAFFFRPDFVFFKLQSFINLHLFHFIKDFLNIFILKSTFLDFWFFEQSYCTQIQWSLWFYLVRLTLLFLKKNRLKIYWNRGLWPMNFIFRCFKNTSWDILEFLFLWMYNEIYFSKFSDWSKLYSKTFKRFLFLNKLNCFKIVLMYLKND